MSRTRMAAAWVTAAGLACISATAALAQAAPPSGTTDDAERGREITSGRSDEGPGGLTAVDVLGKRLLDTEGNPVGTIEKVSPDGLIAIVRPAGGGGRVDVDMSRLSLGMGAHTVIEHGTGSAADQLNAGSAAAPHVSGGSTTTTETYVAPTTVPRTVTTTTETTSVTRKP